MKSGTPSSSQTDRRGQQPARLAWKAKVETIFAALNNGSETSKTMQLVRDSGGQTEYGVQCDVGVATVVTTADLSRVLPIPDDATMMRCTKESLLRCERAASELLIHLQRELTLELQDAGVGFSASMLDEVSHASAMEQRKMKADYRPRNQLHYQGGQTASSKALEDRPEYWAFSAGVDKYSLYPKRAAVSAKTLTDTFHAVEARHQLFEEMERTMHELSGGSLGSVAAATPPQPRVVGTLV